MNDWKPNQKVAQWRKLAEYWGRQTECPAALILAVIEQESGGDKDAVRYEPEYEKKYKARCEEVAAEAGISVSQAASSYGLMQLMLPLAWGYMSEEQRQGNVVAIVCDPAQNVRFGAAHLGVLLKKELNRYNDNVSRALGLEKEIDARIIRAVAGRYNGAGSSSDYAKNVCSLWRRYETWLKEEV
ncbi:lytic transglycosylase domain-containing protein [Cloacibacillus sp. An23]|uniref:lytic transglycosylase domain-containing protein n=1 Tax=Cloacibacillus sp. An23 TaxID=1965591 RepID=UPI0013024496|nr:lytic transglycosylase domain-containing protein [Cloacibacillus sp. An23]